jgi:broad specificity polyphosphatase/5'/3'-nucleotidase SurE
MRGFMRADTAIHELTERTTPKFGVYFDQDRCGIVSAIERAPIVSTGIYGSARITEGQAFHALYIRICVNAASHVVVRNCQAFLLSLEKQQNPNETFIYINLPQPIQLTDKPFDVMPNIPRMVDFMKTSEQDNKFSRTGYWPNALENAFSDNATYRFTIAVNGDGITAPPIKIDVVWQGIWDRVSAHQVQEV